MVGAVPLGWARRASSDWQPSTRNGGSTFNSRHSLILAGLPESALCRSLTKANGGTILRTGQLCFRPTSRTCGLRCARTCGHSATRTEKTAVRKRPLVRRDLGANPSRIWRTWRNMGEQVVSQRAHLKQLSRSFSGKTNATRPAVRPALRSCLKAWRRSGEPSLGTARLFASVA